MQSNEQRTGMQATVRTAARALTAQLAALALVAVVIALSAPIGDLGTAAVPVAEATELLASDTAGPAASCPGRVSG